MAARHKVKRNSYQYNVLDKEIWKRCIEEKEKWINKQCAELEDLQKKDQQLMYTKIKCTQKNMTRTTCQAANNTLRDRNGKCCV